MQPGPPLTRWAFAFQVCMVYDAPMTTARLADRIEPRAFRLAPPRRVEGTGGMIYEAVLAVPGTYYYESLGASVLTPAEVLADEAFIAALTGVPVIDDDRTAHVEGVTTATMQDAAIGRVLRAWWDPEQQALIGELLIDVQRGLEAVARGVTGVSVGYDVDLAEEAGDGYTYRQVARRAPSNVAITLTPRHEVTHLRAADSREVPMNPELLASIKAKVGDAADPMAMFQALIEMVLSHAQRAAELEAQLAETTKQLAEKAGADPAAGDAEDEEAEASATDEAPPAPAEDAKVSTMADAIRVADALGVQIDEAWTLRDLQRAIVIARGVPTKTADALDATGLGAVLAAIREVKVADAFDVISARGRTQPAAATPNPTDV